MIGEKGGDNKKENKKVRGRGTFTVLKVPRHRPLVL